MPGDCCHGGPTVVAAVVFLTGAGMSGANIKRPFQKDGSARLKMFQQTREQPSLRRVLMNVSSTFEANAKTTEVVKSRRSTFDNPAEFAQSTAMFCAALGDYWFDAALTQPLTMRFGVVAAVGVRRESAEWHDERQQLADVVAVRAGQDCTDGDAIRIDEDVMLGTGSRAIRGVRASFSPAPTARTNDESTATREKSSWPVSCNFASPACAVGPTRRPSASRASAASRSNQSQIPTWSTGRTSVFRS